ncbi:MAG: beta-propeller fold lactonase family protein [Pseudomonadales bacterium]|jgi:YVTN family beta-propeller protein|nr:beta-propeller fold lactonase family protein [Pseudomonadales bacterium]
MKTTCAVVLSLAAALALQAPAAEAQRARIVQTNSGSDTISLIDPATQRVVAEIKGIPVNHGAAAAPDGARLYFSSEAKITLDVVDSATLQIIKEIPLSARPNNITIGKDGRFVYVGIMQGAGGMDVIDTQTLENVAHIDTESRVHNVYVTPDGKYVVAGAFGGERNLRVYDTATRALAFALYPPRNGAGGDALDGIRPITFDTHADGSTKNLYVQLSDFHGFTVVDFAAQKEVTRVELPQVPLEQRVPEGSYNRAPSHGIGVAPDQTTLWVASRLNGHVYGYALPDLELIAAIPVGDHPDWLTFSPDGKFVYAANGGSDNVSVIDIAARKELTRIPVLAAPKRNITVILPQ